jgi:hypothetical protein
MIRPTPIQNKLLYAELGDFSIELFDTKRRENCEVCS